MASNINFGKRIKPVTPTDTAPAGGGDGQWPVGSESTSDRIRKPVPPIKSASARSSALVRRRSAVA